jgi:hypothetical protein
MGASATDTIVIVLREVGYGSKREKLSVSKSGPLNPTELTSM